MYTMVIVCPPPPYAQSTIHARSKDRAAIQEYLKASGVPYAVLLTGYFAENLRKYACDHHAANTSGTNTVTL